MKRYIYIAVSALVMICLLSACGGKAGGADGETSADKGETAEQPVRIGVLQIADSFPLYVAEEEGLFEENGLDVEIVEFQSASDQSVAYEAGELDGMMTDMIVQSLVNKSSEDGMKTVAMAFGGDASEGRFIVASSPDSEITEPSQLAGTKIGIS
ncbi:MAG: ABC transporter substrate-binding protein, partial [Lachnospiraceae bacterium]|nr:ABC transporter substrate-binding protein [Lachnospiraceae bacterium]